MRSELFSPFTRCEFAISIHFVLFIPNHNCRFGVELAPEVVKADGNVLNLAWRICNAKKVLVSGTAFTSCEEYLSL